MKAMVLAAGLGTRLAPLTDVVPKPLVFLFDRWLLDYTLSLLEGAGVREVMINTHAHGDAIQRALFVHKNLSFSHEPRILGTGGGLKNVEGFFAGEETFLLMNGDVLFDCDIPAAVAAHRASGAAATMVLAPMPEGASYGAVECDEQMNVLRIAGQGLPGTARPFHFTGVHVLSPRIFPALPSGPSDINRTGYLKLLQDGETVRGHLDHGSWNDLGSPARYLGTHLDILHGRVPLARFGWNSVFRGMEERPGRVFFTTTYALQEGAQLQGPCWVAPQASVGAGARVGPGAVIGRGAEIGPGAIVENAVVWQGAKIAAGEVVRWAIAAGELRVPAAD